MQYAQKYTGLSDAEAGEKLRKNGKNILHKKKKKSAIRIFLSQFTDVMVLILMVCTVISAFLDDWTEALVMIAIVVVNAILGFIQEYKTERTIEALGALSASKATVLRSGVKKSISVEDIVPGDVCLVYTGDRIPADGFIISCEGLTVDESMLTGESVAVAKSKGSLYSGTCVMSGHAVFGVTATGMQTEMGKISNMIQDVEEEETPLQKRLAKMGTYIVLACLAICIIVAGVGILKGEPVMSMLLSGISLAVAAVPEGLPAIVTIALALGVSRMAARNALVRRLPAVETLGCTDVICSDKTGTLTQNKMSVREFVTVGTVLRRKYHATDERMAADISRICNNDGDSTERALLSYFTEKEETVPALGRYTRISEFPFDSSRKCMTVAVRNERGEKYIFTKGAPEVVLKKCTHVFCEGKILPMDGRRRAGISASADRMASNALRILAVAFRRVLPGENVKDRACAESGLVAAGLFGLADPPRAEAKEAVAACETAGIRTVMITGDHKVTAGAIGREIGILHHGEEIVTGEELERMTDEELQKRIPKISVFARVLPVHKLRIVKAFKALGKTVAMTGDGVNDAPAVKAADIGIAMGISGTDVTREASDMVLTDDNFATIVRAVREGRAIYDNIKKFIRYMLACNLGEVITMFLGILCGLPLPLYPIQILWVNLATDGLPGIALGMDCPAHDIMQRPPVPAASGIFSGRMVRLIITRGLLIGLCTLGAFVTVQWSCGSVEAGRTAAFVTLVLAQLVHSFECRSDGKSLLKIDLRENLFLVAADAVSVLMMLAVLYIVPLQGIFRTVPLDLWQWGVVCAFTALVPVVGGAIDSL